MTNQTDKYHAFVPVETVAGKPSPDRCAECGNARGTQYHGKQNYMSDMFGQSKSLRRKADEVQYDQESNTWQG